jgi:hypothetical protein
VTLWRQARARRSFWRGLRHFFAHPATLPDGRRAAEAELQQLQREAQAASTAAAVRVSGARRAYLLVQLALVLVAALAFLVWAPGSAASLMVAAALAWTIFSLISLAAVARAQRIAQPLEIGRHVALAGLLLALVR